jgi:PAS domain S-box-containing protein
MTESSFRRLLLRFALVPLFALCAFVAILGVQISQIARRRIQASQATTILLQSDRVLKSMIDEETGIRGFLVAQDPSFLQPYREASSRFGEELAVLTSIASPNPSLSKKVADVASSFHDFDAINKTLLNSGLSHDTAVGLLRRQKQAMEILRAELADITAEASDSRELQRKEIDSLYAALPAIAIGGGAIVAVLLVLHGISIFNKITRAFRQQLNDSQIQRDYLHTTLQSIGDAVVVCDESGRVTFLNPIAQKVMGWNQAEAVGQPLENIFRIINEYTRESVDSPVAKVLEAGSIVGLANHTLLVRPDGSEIPIDDSGAPIRDRYNRIVGVVLVFRDITERKRNEELIRKSNKNVAHLAAIIGSADDAIVSKDLNGIVESWNEGARRMFGYAADEMVGRSILRLIPQELQYEEDQILRKLRAGERVDHFETTRKKKNGETFEVSVTISPMRDETGNIIGASKVARDISDRKRVERLLIQSEKLAATGRMAATIAHEINNPLESLMNLVFLARQKSSEGGEVHGYLLTAEGELERVSHIARQTLGFYRDTGAPTDVYLHELLNNVLTVYNSKLLTSEIVIDTQFNDLQKVHVRKGELLQVSSNLIANAADAMRQGGKLEISTQQVVGPAGDGVETVITDNGAGIPEEHLAQIFEPFFTTKGDLGTGIGLWVAKQLVEMRGGEISVASSTENGNCGTTVRVFIPYAIPIG